MSDDINAIPAEDFLPGIFDANTDSLGYEWITDKKVARYVGVVKRECCLWLTLSSFGVLGTPIKPRLVQFLAESESFSKHEKVSLYGDQEWSQVLNATSTPLSGFSNLLAFGEYYGKYLVTSVSLVDGESTVPSFMAFDPQTRTLSISPTFSDVG